MYFNEKEDTNIDKEFKHEFNFADFLREHLKMFIAIGIGRVLLLIILFVVVKYMGMSKYSLNLNGGNEITVYQGIDYTDPGYVAYDKNHRNVSSQVRVNGRVQTDVVGQYKITYTIGNKSITRTVNVVDRPDVVTMIYLQGDLNMSMNVGSEFTEPGYRAADAKDGDLTEKVTVTNNVDASKAGIYRVTYSVVNSDGVTTSVSRTVTVK